MDLLHSVGRFGFVLPMTVKSYSRRTQTQSVAFLRLGSWNIQFSVIYIAITNTYPIFVIAIQGHYTSVQDPVTIAKACGHTVAAFVAWITTNVRRTTCIQRRDAAAFLRSRETGNSSTRIWCKMIPIGDQMPRQYVPWTEVLFYHEQPDRRTQAKLETRLWPVSW